MKYKKIFKIARGSLSKLFSKEFLIFCIFLVLSGMMWMMSVLNDTMERDIEIPVRLVNIPQNIVVTSDTIDTIRVTVRDKGFTIASYYYGQEVKPVEIDFKVFMGKKNSDNITVSNAEMQKLIAKSLYNSTRIVQVKPDRMIYYYNYGQWKKVPIVLNGEIQASQEHYLQSVTFSPDSVIVYGTKETLQGIQSVKTVRVDLDGVTKPQTLSVDLQIPTATKCVPTTVKMNVYVDILTEKELEVEVKPVNVPEGIQLRTFPARVMIKFVVGTENFRNIKAEQFVVEADYNDIIKNPEKTKCPLKIQQSPRNVMRPELETPEVEYLIEK